MNNPLCGWEDRLSFFGSVKALFCLSANILFRPVQVFGHLARTGAAAGPQKRIFHALLFALILNCIRIFAEALYVPEAALRSSFFFLRPLIAFTVMLGLMAASVKLVLGFQRPLWPVILLVSYKSAADLFYVIPSVGPVFAAVWSVALVVIGVRELYALPMAKALLAGIVMPLLLLFFVLLSLGPQLTKTVVAVFPEAGKEMSRLNDVNAYYSARAVTDAAQAYQKDLGFYPAHLGLLKKYLSASVAGEVADQSGVGGYAYDYTRVDDGRFILTVRPLPGSNSGRYVFYADETGVLRLNNAQGPAVEGLLGAGELKAMDQKT